MLITCQECMARIYPEDPRVKSGKYHLCSCDYCNKPDYYRDLEVRPSPQVIEHRHSDMSEQDFARLRNLEGQVKYLEGKLTERTKPKHKTKPTAYKGIK